VMVIEEYEHAKKRGATIYGEVGGLASTASAELSPIAPDASGETMAYAVKKALKEAGLEPGQINLVIPSGYGVPDWDKADVAALKRVFNPIPPVLAARAGIGDCGAGAQGLDLVAGLLALREQVIPPATNIDSPLDGITVARHKTPANIQNVLVLSSAMGGQNSAVVLKKTT